jgi:hypothetical protein
MSTDDSTKHPLEGEDQPSSAPAEATPRANNAEQGDAEDAEASSVRALRRLIREKMRAQGRPFPDSPPPPPTLADSHPLARELLDAGGEVIYEKISCWIVKHACGTKVTKFQLNGIRPAEVEAMRFVSENTTIPVPRVYDVGEKHFTMEFIEGETLKVAWEKTLSVEDRALVARQLRD